MSVTAQKGMFSYKESSIYENWVMCGKDEPYHVYNQQHFLNYVDTGIKCKNCKSYSCGDVRYFGCCGKAKAVKTSCDRLRCKVCKGSAIVNRGYKMAERLFELKRRRLKLNVQKYTRNRFIHVVVSPPPDTKESFKVLRSKAVKSLKSCGMFGGVMVVHTIRCRDSPFEKDGIHFHAVGLGWIENTEKNFEKENMVVRNFGVRNKPIRTSLSYLLDHCSVTKVAGKHHSIIWFGDASYNQLKFVQEKINRLICSVCKNEMQEMKFIATDRPPPYTNEFNYDEKDWEKVSVNYV